MTHRTHVQNIAIFECTRISVVRDTYNGCVSLYLGDIVINVYHPNFDSHEAAPEVVECSLSEAVHGRFKTVEPARDEGPLSTAEGRLLDHVMFGIKPRF
jgi:hypothetical protein